MSLPRKSRATCAGDGFDVRSCGLRAKVLDGIVPRCVLCMRRRRRTLERIERGEQELEDSMMPPPKGVCLNRAAQTLCKWPRCDCRVGIIYTTAYKTAGIPRR